MKVEHFPRPGEGFAYGRAAAQLQGLSCHSAGTGGQDIFAGEPAVRGLFPKSCVCCRAQLTGAARASPQPDFPKADGL